MEENEVLKRYRDHLKARKFSLCYFNYISLFLKYCHEHNIDYNNINEGLLTDFLNHGKYSANTTNLFIKSGRHFYKFLGVSDDKNEWIKIKYVRTTKRKPEYINEEELKELSKHLPNKLALVILFMYNTGIRREELLTLKRQNIDLMQNPCTVKVMGKGSKERFIYFSGKYSPKLREKLMEYFQSEEEQTNAFNISLSQLNYACSKLNKYSIVTHIHPHLFRHSYAKTMMGKGLPITYLSYMLGHSNISTTQAYTNPTEELIKAYF